jgi:peroxiredoxin
MESLHSKEDMMSFPNEDVWIADKSGNFTKAKSQDLFSGNLVIIFMVPGAFTKTCSTIHLPGFVKNAKKLFGMGVDKIICLSTDTIDTLTGWLSVVDANRDSRIIMVSDVTRALLHGLGLELHADRLGEVYKRSALLLRNGKELCRIVEDDSSQCTLTSASSVMAKIEDMLREPRAKA